MKPRIDRIVSLIFETRRMMHEQKEGSSEKSCSFMHLITLKHVSEKMPLMKELAEFLGIAPPSATSLVDVLVKNALVKREADKVDRRIVRIAITSKGEKFLEAHKKKMAEKMRENLGKLSITEQQHLEKILEKITKQ